MESGWEREREGEGVAYMHPRRTVMKDGRETLEHGERHGPWQTEGKAMTGYSHRIRWKAMRGVSSSRPIGEKGELGMTTTGATLSIGQAPKGGDNTNKENWH